MFAAHTGAADVLAGEALELVERGADGLEASEARADELLGTLLGLGLAIGHSPWLRDTAAVARLREVGDDLLPLVPGLSMFVARLEGELNAPFEWGDEWEDAALRRSALAFLLELFGPSEAFEGLSLDAVDAMLRARGAVEGGAPAPEGIPDAHWWWRCGPG